MTLRRSDIIFLVCIGALLTMAAIAAANAATSRTIVIKFPHVTAPGTPKGQGAERFRELVAERLGDRGVIVEVYPSGSLMIDEASIEALAFGEIQMIAVSLSNLDRLTHKLQLFDLPFMFDDIDAVSRFMESDTGQDLLTVVEDKGIRGLAFWHNGMKQLTGPRPLLTPGDAEGLKFRIMSSDVLQAQMLAMGATPQKMAFPEVYQALQTGAIDAQENTYANIYSSKFFEVQPYITESNHGYIGYFVATNTEFWNSLPDDIRAELEDIMDETTAYSRLRAREVNSAARESVVDTGRSEILALSAEEKALWRDAMAPVWEEFAPMIGEELVAAAVSAGQ